MPETAMSNATIERYAQEYFIETKTEIDPNAMGDLINDIRVKMVALDNGGGRDAVREALRAVLTCREVRAWLAANA